MSPWQNDGNLGATAAAEPVGGVAAPILLSTAGGGGVVEGGGGVGGIFGMPITASRASSARFRSILGCLGCVWCQNDARTSTRRVRTLCVFKSCLNVRGHQFSARRFMRVTNRGVGYDVLYFRSIKQWNELLA